jgi:hypothetical protein
MGYVWNAFVPFQQPFRDKNAEKARRSENPNAQKSVVS